MNNFPVPVPLLLPFRREGKHHKGLEAGKAGSPADVLFAIKYPLHILVADEDYISRRVMILMLQRLGYAASSAENGETCVESALKSHYDLIFMEIDMPVMDGVECTRSLRAVGVHSSIVAVTVTPPEFARVDCLAAGMNGYIEKPVIIDDIKRALRLAFLEHLFEAA